MTLIEQRLPEAEQIVDPLQLTGDQLFEHISTNGLVLNLGMLEKRDPITRLNILENKLYESRLLGKVTIKVSYHEPQPDDIEETKPGFIATFNLRKD